MSSLVTHCGRLRVASGISTSALLDFIHSASKSTEHKHRVRMVVNSTFVEEDREIALTFIEDMIKGNVSITGIEGQEGMYIIREKPMSSKLLDYLTGFIVFASGIAVGVVAGLTIKPQD